MASLLRIKPTSVDLAQQTAMRRIIPTFCANVNPASPVPAVAGGGAAFGAAVCAPPPLPLPLPLPLAPPLRRALFFLAIVGQAPQEAAVLRCISVSILLEDGAKVKMERSVCFF
jgi:hypothetical protein